MLDTRLSKYRQILLTTIWQNQIATTTPENIQQWLRLETSLTKKIQDNGNIVEVEVVSEKWQEINFWSNVELCWIREVILKGNAKKWIFAQTILPQRTIENVAQDVLTLGDNPIGLWLFPQNPERVCLEWAIQKNVYARRSLFQLKKYPIEIKELFLEDFPFLL